MWVQGGQPERLYLWCTFVNTLHLSQWNKWHTYMLRGVSPKGWAPGEGEIRGEVISTFIFFMISFFRHIWSQCKLEIRRTCRKWNSFGAGQSPYNSSAGRARCNLRWRLALSLSCHAPGRAWYPAAPHSCWAFAPTDNTLISKWDSFTAQEKEESKGKGRRGETKLLSLFAPSFFLSLSLVIQD